MKWITTLCMICTFHFAGFSIEPEKSVFDQADSLSEVGNWNAAALAYERVAYQSFDNSTRTRALIKKAENFALLNEFDLAQKTMLRISFFGLSDSLQYCARYSSAFYSYLNTDFEEAISQLLIIESFLPIEYSLRSKPLYALSLNEAKRWDESKLKLLEWVDYKYANDIDEKDSLHSVVEELYLKKHQPKFRDPEKAELWSTFLPGTGQLYSGYLFDGAFTAAMVLSGLGIAAVGIFVVKYYVTGVILGYIIYQRFYLSGQKRSVFLAKKGNYLREKKYNSELRSLILRVE